MTKTILLADDSATIRKIVELTFSESEFRVESVASGAEALERLEDLQPDVVLADVTMPTPGGYELCRRVKQSGRAIPVLLLAGTFEPFDEQLADRCAADGHLVKPFESSTLVKKIDALLAAPPRVLEEEAPAAGSSVEAGEDGGDPDAGPDVENVTVAQDTSDDDKEVAVVTADAPASAGGRLDPADVRAIARELVGLIGDDVVREIAAGVVPEIADRVVRERIRELEAVDDDADAASARKD